MLAWLLWWQGNYSSSPDEALAPQILAAVVAAVAAVLTVVYIGAAFWHHAFW